ncbi:unnamed protein product [Meloidogyne enterolobii]|uniref:Uncharacterized protein n=1 Tax=Meloidogyne enterolobii TaxID=390850 RepID=A0ACB1A4Y0_MELEN
MPKNKKLNKKSALSGKDDLLLDLAKNPIFNEMPIKKNKIKIDKRFEAMLTDKRFDDRDFRVDKRGKPVRGKGGNFAKRIYEMSEGSEESDEKGSEVYDEEGEENDDEDTEEVDEGKNGSNEEKNDEEENDQEEKDDDDEDDESSDDDELPQISLDLARGEAPDVNSSSSEDEEDKSEISDEENTGPDLEEGVRRVEWASTRLAICNMDWSKISAEALMIVIQSLKPSSGVIHSVSVYLSDFGAERLEYEKLHGPKIIVQPSKRKDQSDLEERTRQAIHAYELDRLRYYYAVCHCDTLETAIAIYEACDGVEYESSGENRLRDRVTQEEINLARFKPKNVKTHPLQCSNPKLSWEEGDLERKMKMKNAFGPETKLEDFESLVAPGSDEDEETQKNRYQILISAARESALEKGDMFSVKQFSNKEEKEETKLLSDEKFVSLNDKKDGIVEDSDEDSAENEEITKKKKQTKFQIYLERKKKIKAERKKKELEQRKERKRQNKGENEEDDGNNEKNDDNANWHHVKKDERFTALFHDSAFAIDKTHSQYKGGDLANRQVYGKISQKRRIETTTNDLLPDMEDNNSLVERLKRKQKKLMENTKKFIEMTSTSSTPEEAGSDDSFYDSDLDEEFADAANRSVHDPSTPFVPVQESPREEKKLGTTLSGRRLGSMDSAKASKSVLEECTTIPEVDSTDEETENINKNSQVNLNLTPMRTFSAANKSPNPSFIRASFFYCEAKEKLNKNKDDREETPPLKETSCVVEDNITCERSENKET